MACSSPDGTNSVVYPGKSYLATVGIDFGTAYSGFAFSFNKEQGDPIFMNRDWVNELGHRTSKTPTCLLLKPDQSFDSFGYKAVEKYANLKSVYEGKQHYFFQHFKMTLHNNEDIDLKTPLYDVNRKRMEAKKVFAHSIKFLGEEAVKLIRQETEDDDFKVEDIQWVLTVPAIWTPRAKQFMREAAYEAGIVSRDNAEQLVIALEPEAAALFCTEKKMAAIQPERMNLSVDGFLSQPNAQYMVIDIGGGTLDVTVHEKQDDGTIKEIHKVTGGPYGGMKVNHQFKSLLNELFGDQELYDYRQLFPVDWLKLKNDFEEKKRGVRALEGKETRILLPRSFTSQFSKIRPCALERYGADEVKMMKNEYLCLSPRIMVGLFSPVLEAMKGHLLTLLTRPQLSMVRTMLLVGGFADSPVLQQEIKNEFAEKCRVIIPRNADKAVVQGAVMFGKLPATITARVVGITYGAECCRDFIQGVHPEKKKFVADGMEKCKDIFSRFVKENEAVKLGQRIRKTFHPVRANDTLITFGFYTATDPEAQFVTDDGLNKIGSITVQSPDIRRGRDREIEVSMYFGGTEITATAVDLSSGNVEQTTLDFLCTVMDNEQ